MSEAERLRGQLREVDQRLDGEERDDDDTCRQGRMTGMGLARRLNAVLSLLTGSGSTLRAMRKRNLTAVTLPVPTVTAAPCRLRAPREVRPSMGRTAS